MPESTNLQGLLDGFDGGLAILRLLLGRFNLLGSRLLLGSSLLLGSRLTHAPRALVEIDLDAILSCNLAKKFLNLECFSSASRGRRGLRLNDGLLDEFHRILI